MTMSPKLVFRLAGGVSGVGVLFMVIALFTLHKPKATVTGRVTHRGKPVIWGTVLLFAPDGKSAAGRIEPDGTYTVENAPVSPVNVAVVSQDPLYAHYARQIKSKREKVPMKQWAAPPVDRKKWFPLPQKYEDPKTSGLTMSLKGGPNTWDLEVP
jgi:hypothetical protein